ncbi:hypothetical protein KR032_009340 [Drosophila birchii]|nr:hypothetical protein KR032_009340 [Drosophila birchii]
MLNAKRNRTAVNVCITSGRISEDLSFLELLGWVNDSLQAQFSKINELCTGAAYCQFMDMLFPDSVNMDRVKFFTNEEAHFIQNFKILEAGFKKMSVDMEIPIDRLIKGRFLDNLRFVKWFKLFFDANYESRSYNPRMARDGAPTLVTLWKRKTTARKSFSPKVASPIAQLEKVTAVHEKPGLILKDFQPEKVTPGEPMHVGRFTVEDKQQTREGFKFPRSSLILKRSKTC